MGSRFIFEEKTHGAGGFGRVIRGRDSYLERDVAVKVLNQLTRLPDQERFKREARILASLQHPNIPAIYDVEFSKDRFLIVFQFVAGKNLKQIITEEGGAPLSDVRRWFRQIASALDHAHASSIVHRDIKPANIIVSPSRETAYLVDFGLAISKEEGKKISESGFVYGTPGYMSPEQLAGKKLDGRSDIYSLGVTLYETLAGAQVPQYQQDYHALSATDESIPPQIDDLIVDCLKPVDERVSTVSEFANRLAGALQSTKPLSDILASGQLYELATYLQDKDASDLSNLPEGQKTLIVLGVTDIVSSGESRLDRASESLLELLVTRGLLFDKRQYSRIARPAIEWAFDKDFKGSLGSEKVRKAVREAAKTARGEALETLVDAFVDFLGSADLEGKENWFYHTLREVLQTILANPDLKGVPNPIVEAIQTINDFQRARRKSADTLFLDSEIA